MMHYIMPRAHMLAMAAEVFDMVLTGKISKRAVGKPSLPAAAADAAPCAGIAVEPVGRDRVAALKGRLDRPRRPDGCTYFAAGSAAGLRSAKAAGVRVRTPRSPSSGRPESATGARRCCPGAWWPKSSSGALPKMSGSRVDLVHDLDETVGGQVLASLGCGICERVDDDVAVRPRTRLGLR
jgi:hypothetical protein